MEEIIYFQGGPHEKYLQENDSNSSEDFCITEDIDPFLQLEQNEQKPKQQKPKKQPNFEFAKDPVCIQKIEKPKKHDEILVKKDYFQKLAQNIQFEIQMVFDGGLRRDYVQLQVIKEHGNLVQNVEIKGYNEEIKIAALVMVGYFTESYFYWGVIMGLIIIYAKMMVQIQRNVRMLRKIYEKSQKIVGITSKLISRFEEMKFLNPKQDLSEYESFIHNQISNINLLFIGGSSSEKNIKKLNNEILINSLKFNTVSLKFDVIPKNGLEEALRKISSIENEIKCHMEMGETEVIAREHLNQRKEPENSYTMELQILRSLIRKIDGDLVMVIKEMDKERYQEIETEMETAMGLYKKCKSLFEEENVKAFREKKKFRMKERIEIKENGEKEKEIEKLPRVEKKMPPPKTEVFENFEILEENIKVEKKQEQDLNHYVGYKQPCFNFMDELKEKLSKRQKEMENEQVTYKEFDPKNNSFKPISKEERDQKEVKLKEKISLIEQEQEKERQEIQNIQNKMQNAQQSLFSELMMEQQESDDEVFS